MNHKLAQHKGTAGTYAAGKNSRQNSKVKCRSRNRVQQYKCMPTQYYHHVQVCVVTGRGARCPVCKRKEAIAVGVEASQL